MCVYELLTQFDDDSEYTMCVLRRRMRKLVTAAYIADGRRRPVAMITGFVSLLPITSEAVIFGIYHSLSQTNQSEYVRMYSRVRRARVDYPLHFPPHAKTP